LWYPWVGLGLGHYLLHVFNIFECQFQHIRNWHKANDLLDPRVHCQLGKVPKKGLPDPGPSIIMQKWKKNLDSYYFVTLFDFLSLKNDVNAPSKINKQKKLKSKIRFLLAS
jgi:hypothetical protein